MRWIKILLVIIVLYLIGYLICKWFIKTDPPVNHIGSENQYVLSIDKLIDSLKQVPASKSSTEIYNQIQLLINEYYQPYPPKYPNGRLGDSKSLNDQFKEEFQKRSYNIYVMKFDTIASGVLGGRDCNESDISYVRSEYTQLINSPFLGKGGQMYRKLEEHKSSLDKYYEIVGFIIDCRNFSYFETLISASFPIEEMKKRKYKALGYLENKPENRGVNNCTRIQQLLNQIPQYLFNAHVKYLQNKIQKQSGQFKSIGDCQTYDEILFNPIMREIEALSIHSISSRTSVKSDLISRWKEDRRAAYIWCNR